MIEVELPDGSIAEFPDGTSNDAIKAAMQKRFGAPQQSRSFWGTVKDNFIGDDDPTTQNTGEKVGSFINRAIETGTFGLLGDEASGALAGMIPGGQTAEEARDFQRQQQALFQRENPEAAVAADIVGAVGGALAPGGAIGTLGRGAGLGARVAASSAAGSGMGGLYGFMEGDGGLEDRLDEAGKGAIWGAAGGAVAPALGGAVQRGMDRFVGGRAIKSAARNAPSADDLRALGSQLYDEVDRAGVQVKAPAFDDVRQKIVQALQGRTAYTPRPGGRTITPNTSAVVDNMADMADEMAGQTRAALPFKEIDSLRRQAGAAAGNVANKSDQQAGMTIIEGLDDFVQNIGNADVEAGDIEALKAALPKARETWARMSKSQMLDDAISQQDNYLSGGASAIRNRFASILRNPKLSRGFSDAEKKAMQRVVSGSIPQQIVNYMGSGLGMMGQMGMGAAIGGPVGFTIGAGLAAGSRKAAEKMTQRNAEMARALVANGTLNTLPVATDQGRRIVEALIRRTSAGAPQ